MERRAVFILNFHGLGDPGRELPAGEAAYWIDPKFFEEILDVMAKRADVRITFDDSNESDFTLALPLLKARGMKAQFFLVAGRIDQKHYLSRGQIGSLLKEGMTVGNHGMVHQRWRGLDDRSLREELVQARDILQNTIGVSVKTAACPFGEYDRRVLGALRESGYDTVYTSDGGPAQPDEWVQARNTISRSHDLKHVARVCSEVPSGVPGLKRRLKLMLKRWR